MYSTALNKLGIGQLRIKQFENAYYKNFILNIDNISTWPLKLKEVLKNKFIFPSIRIIHQFESKDGKTKKFLFETTRKKLRFETVLMMYKNNENTLCLSCMSGCPVGCKFCATGSLGFKGALSALEIIEQLIFTSSFLKQKNRHITNIVFMGMGEPLLNYNNVFEAYKNMVCKMGVSSRNIVISTVGIPDKIIQLAEDGFKGKLALSLHSADQNKRIKLIPIAKKYSLNAVLKAIDTYQSITNKRVTFEYVLINRLNDNLQDIKHLIKLLQNRNALVNFIHLNKTGSVFNSVPLNKTNKILTLLRNSGITATLRKSMGNDIIAACGQLVVKKGLQ